MRKKKRFFYRQEGRWQMSGRRGAGLGGSDPGPHRGWVTPLIEVLVPSLRRGPIPHGGGRSHHWRRADPLPVPPRGRLLATAVTTRRPLPPVPGQLSPATGHPDSRPRPPTFPSVPLPAAAQSRACPSHKAPVGGGEKAAEPSPRGRGRAGRREGSTWKSLSSLKRENLSAISRRPGPAPAAAASALSAARLHRPRCTAHARPAGHVRSKAAHVIGKGGVPHGSANARSGVAVAAAPDGAAAAGAARRQRHAGGRHNKGAEPVRTAGRALRAPPRQVTSSRASLRV